MLKFIKHHMTSIVGIEIWPILGFLLFFTFFLGMLWYVFTFSRRHVTHMEHIPFNDNGTTSLERPVH